jgi:hypothetical protein
MFMRDDLQGLEISKRELRRLCDGSKAKKWGQAPLDTKVDGVNRSLTEKIDGVDKSLTEKIDGVVNKSLGEKIDGIGKRVDTQEFINRGVIIGLLLAILGGLAKVSRNTESHPNQVNPQSCHYQQ